MDLQSALLVVLSIVAAVLVAQTILLLVFVMAFRNWCRTTQSTIAQIARASEPVLESARELITDTREKVASVSANLNEISALAKTQMVRVDGFLKDTTERAQLQVVRLDELVGDTMNRVSETTEAIQQGILTPVREISALVAGVRASLDFLFRRTRKTVERATQDEELFI